MQTGPSRLEFESNLDIIKELNTQRTLQFIENYRFKWKNRVLLKYRAQETHLNFLATI
jgi:hypothetical protein